MDKAGIFENTLLTVCKCCQPENNNIVIVFVEDGFTVKRYRKQNNKIYLIPESTNPAHKTRIIDTERRKQYEIWGRVIGIHSKV